MNVLAELNVHDKPMITVLNKIDKITDQSWLKDLQGNYESAVYISALKETNIDALTNLLIQTLSPLVVEVDVTIPIKRMDLVNLAHEKGQVLSVKYYNDTIHLRASLPAKVAAQFKSFA